MVLLRRRQLRRHISDNLLPLLAHLPAARCEQQIAVDGVLDRALQPADLRLIGGNLRRQRRVLLLNLLILRLELVVFALRDAGGEEQRSEWDNRCRGGQFANHDGRSPRGLHASPSVPAPRRAPERGCCVGDSGNEPGRRAIQFWQKREKSRLRRSAATRAGDRAWWKVVPRRANCIRRRTARIARSRIAWRFPSRSSQWVSFRAGPALPDASGATASIVWGSSPAAPGNMPAMFGPPPRSTCRVPGYRAVDRDFPPPPCETAAGSSRGAAAPTCPRGPPRLRGSRPWLRSAPARDRA